jgi:outer membrane murein-binding lipoprotein Lpp
MTTTPGDAAATLLIRFLLLSLAAWTVLLLDISSAHAQAANCSRLESMLRTLDRNEDFQNAQSGDLRQLQRQVQRAESAYVRAGCNADAKAGRQLSSQCRGLARDVLDLREQVAGMAQSVDTGQAVAQQREAILQEMSRFDCDGRSRVTIDRGGDERGNLFERLFGVFTDDGFGAGGVRGDQFNPYGDYHTVRTLCVRKTDGFYWPISYSTLVDYVPNDAEQCRAMCPGLDVDLYYYDNPGQEPDQMINQWGESYAALPSAFRFRTEFDTASKCTSTQDQGAIEVAQMFDGGTRAMVSFRGETFPLPLRDARRIVAPTVAAAAPVQVADAATYVDIPLPRRRPSAPGEPVPAVAVVPPTATQPERIVMFGNKRVRIVGPETPYVQAAATGT